MRDARVFSPEFRMTAPGERVRMKRARMRFARLSNTPGSPKERGSPHGLEPRLREAAIRGRRFDAADSRVTIWEHSAIAQRSGWTEKS